MLGVITCCGQPSTQCCPGRSAPGSEKRLVGWNWNGELTEEIRVIHQANYGVYGARKIHAALLRRGHTVARCTVERLMRQASLRGVIRVKSPRTTRPAAETARPAELVNRQFTAQAPNQLWVADITYIRTFSGWVYAAFVIDVFSRMVVGWQVTTSLTPTSPWTPWRWRYGAAAMPAATCRDWCTTPTAACNTAPSATPSASSKLRSSPRSAPRSTHMTTPSRRHSTVCSRPN
ncbi:hypothetical protein C4B68_00180 [Streptomyces dengpaensis]|uniref:Integrase catalytic domain-containing protein n=1 Tax=Streptomyces dengpaensis TaxID=2049881 RepID=A0ABN5HVA4_9ACTN|nr:hypothetical protein C4B68_00180 [Streptomyces dengpaensis]